MSEEDRDDKVTLSTFKGESKQEYRSFIYRFEAWEDSKKTRYATSTEAGVDPLLTDEEYWQGHTVEEQNGVEAEIPLTRADKRRYEDNAKSRAKLFQYVDESLLEPLIAAGGTKNSVWLMKQWLRLNYAEVTAEDSLIELTNELKELHPGDFKEALLYLGQLESLNAKLRKIDATERYALDELQLKTEVLSKISEGEDNKSWGPFKADYRRTDQLRDTTWTVFKTHLTNEWRAVGTPSGGTAKTLNVQVPGSKYFPGKCNHCGEKGHKQQDCPKKKAGVPKKGKKDKQGGKWQNGKKKRGPRNGVCYNCGKPGHFASDCRKPRQDRSNEDDDDDTTAVVLAIKEITSKNLPHGQKELKDLNEMNDFA